MHAEADNGRARLVGGRADPRGDWGYGVLQVLVSGAWSIIEDSPFVQGVQFGRRGAQVACRSLGYTTGAQILAGRSSPLQTLDTDIVAVKSISCDGSEDTLGDCGLEYTNAYLSDYGYEYFDRESTGINEGTTSVVLVCVTPSGAPHTAAVLMTHLLRVRLAGWVSNRELFADWPSTFA